MAPTHRFLAIAALALVSACHAGASPDAAPAPAAPEAAVQAFLAAVDSNAIDRMAELWGDENGPPTDRRIVREREQRLAIIQRLLQHDAYQFVPDPGSVRPPAGRRMLFVELRRGEQRATVAFTLVGQRRGGWLVENIGLEALMPSANPRRTGTP